MGHVFSATDLETTAAVAVKVVSRVFFDDVLMARLHREAEAAAIIRSDYVPHVLEVSETEEREVFLVMERLMGEPLSAKMRSTGPMPWGEVSKIAEDILRGLIDAHTAGIVHRDLKPSNVFLAIKRGRVRAMILDFGVCKIDVRGDAERLTGTGESIGTVAYMAPEQIRGASKVDDRADLYAFGALVFEMLCGRLPHEGPSQMAILASKLEKEAARLRDCAQVEVPAGLDELLAKTLAREPAERPASAQDLLKAWRGLTVSGMLAPTPSTPFVAGPPDDAPTVASRPDGFDAPRSSSRQNVPEPVATQNAVTTGTSIDKSRGGARLAIALAACGLVAGFAGVAAFFARSPSSGAAAGGAGGASAASASVDPSVSPSASASEAPEPAITTVWEVTSASGAGASGDPPGADPAAASPVASVRRLVGPRFRPRVGAPPPPPPPPTAKPNAPHITEKPRF